MKWDNFEGEDSEKMLKMVDNSDEMLTGDFEIKYKIESTEVFMDIKTNGFFYFHTTTNKGKFYL